MDWACCDTQGIRVFLLLFQRESSGVHNFLCLFRRWHSSLRTDRRIFSSCCSSTVSARPECCELGFASYQVHLLQDDRVRSLHGVLDDLGLFQLHCLGVVLVMLVTHATTCYTGSLLDLVLRYTISSAGPCVFETCCVIFETLVICFC